MLINSKIPFHCVYIEQKTAFDRISHAKLLDKLAHTGIHPRTRTWIKFFLTDRRFRVVVDSHESSDRSARSGVPPGSCLFPILYAIFLMDIARYLPTSINHLLFADDLKLYWAVRNEKDARLLQHAIDQVTRWRCENDTEISVHKSAVIQLGPFSTTYRIDGCEIPIVDHARDLGVLTTADLDFSRHVHDI